MPNEAGPGIRDVPPAVSEALAAAVRWRLLGLLFERPRPGWLDEVRNLAREVTDPALEAVALEAERADEGNYLSVLGPGGAVSPREVAYRPMGDPGKILSEVSGYYRAFAHRPSAEDPADHVAIETGFVGYLMLKESYALARNDTDAARTTREAIGVFIRDHLGSFAEELSQRLTDSAAGHLPATAAILAGWCRDGEAPGRQ